MAEGNQKRDSRRRISIKRPRIPWKSLGQTGIILGSLWVFSPPSWSQSIFLGKNGIEADKLSQAPYFLTGQKIAIGQVEIGRAAQFGWDKIAAWQPSFSLAGIFFRDRRSGSNQNLDHHAAMVAGVLIGRDKYFPGIAPGAKLYSGAVGPLRESSQAEECLTSQFLSQQNGGDVRAINFSFGESLNRDPRFQAQLDGEALLSQCIDWLARTQNVVFVIAGNQGEGGIPIPTDHYNGLTVAFSRQVDGVYRKVDFANLARFPRGIGRRLIAQEVNTHHRASIALIAPGSQILTYDLSGKLQTMTGTSFAAPQVTGTIALLQEYGDRLLREKFPHWSLAARRQEVMKAVLLNAADKLKDSGNGQLLGMSRDILTQKNRTWRDSEAYQNLQIPLDWEMGTGQLNAWRAWQQFSAGQWSPDAEIPPLGWDYNTITAEGLKDYVLAKPLQQNSYVSITLAWNRWVELQDKNQNQQYDLGETFHSKRLNNLDLYLVPVDPPISPENTSITCASTSLVDNLEHIFCPIPQTGHYKIQVKASQTFHPIHQPYALSWWTVSAP